MGELIARTATRAAREYLDARNLTADDAALLLPHWLLREQWNRLESNPTGRTAIPCDLFGVSRSALAGRLTDLQLPDGHGRQTWAPRT
jgi:hypothetical protein